MMIAYHGKEELKAERIERIREHRRQENLLQAFGYWQDGKGCAVGCTVESSSNPHARYETEMGIPRSIALLEDSTFEGLPEADAMAWPERFLQAIPVGADLSKVLNHFSAWLLTEESGLLTITDINREAIATVAALHARAAAGEEIEASQWRSAESAARSAAWSAARSAAESAAESAESAAWSAARSAESAAESAAWSAAESAAWVKIAGKLIELLAAAPVQVGSV